MKYNHELFTRESFRAWLASQPTDRTFQYCDNKNCVFASFLKEKLGVAFPNVGPEDFDICDNASFSSYSSRHILPAWANKLSLKMAANKGHREPISIAEVLKLDAAI